MTAGEGGALITQRRGAARRAPGATSTAAGSRASASVPPRHLRLEPAHDRVAGRGAAGAAAALPRAAPHARGAARTCSTRRSLKHPRPAAAGGDPRIDSRARYCYVVHYDADEFAGLPLAGSSALWRRRGFVVRRLVPEPRSTLELFRDAALRAAPSRERPAPRLRRRSASPRAEQQPRAPSGSITGCCSPSPRTCSTSPAPWRGSRSMPRPPRGRTAGAAPGTGSRAAARRLAVGARPRSSQLGGDVITGPNCQRHHRQRRVLRSRRR